MARRAARSAALHRADGLTAQPVRGRLRYGRVLLVLALALGLAPGTLVRTQLAGGEADARISATRVSELPTIEGPLRLTDVWVLTSDHPFFGGFSALVDEGGGTILAASDRGWAFDIGVSGKALRPQYFRRFARAGRGRHAIDVEALTRDPVSGTLWAAYEQVHAIERIAPDGRRDRREPEAMARWPGNSGAETMVRLEDGRFLVIAESEGPESTHTVLLFAGDPVAKGPVADSDPVRLTLQTPKGYAPVDGTQLPDGSVLVLLRRVKLGLPPTFEPMILRVDPAAIRAGETWRGEVIARLTAPLFAENFEGIAYRGADEHDGKGEGEGGGGALYLIADDNFSTFQRTLLVRLALP